ncbi:MAG TPA: amylo-alpha-1,6-glucosidase [Stellaceae bacterium]|nr:amylo-alpha-1,6-glucosidase [Stellaceae bacterium]
MADPLSRLAPIRFGRAVCGDLAAAERREWWLADGRGGYAGGTIAQSLTRRYHALLVAPVDPPLGRVLVLAKADARLVAEGVSQPLFANRWAGGAVEPAGHLALESFELDGTIPVWRFALGDRIVEERVWLEPGAGTVYVAWRLDGEADGAAAHISVALLANGRDHHGDTWPPGFSPQITVEGSRLTMTAPNRFELQIAATGGGSIAPRQDWYRDFDLPVECERGLGARDSHLHVGDLALPLASGGWAGFAAGLAPQTSPDLGAALERRRAHDRAVLDRAAAADPVFAAASGWVMRLVLATDAFVIARPLPDLPEGRSVIAGYPWFGDWGRDTMISLPGLCLATGRFEAARLILETFAQFVDRGMLPNVFPGAGAVPEYNTADASLWFVEAWRAYVEATGDEAALRRTFPVLADIIGWHLKGTRYGIAVDPADGLLHAGQPGIQLTWMDARVDDWVVTPRIGKPVEINALWYNALVAIAGMAERIGAPSASYRLAAAEARQGFGRFAQPDGNGLYDVLDGPHGPDPSLRPNQIFAVSLPASPLDPAMQRAVVEHCGRALVTSYGLRSLAPQEPGYRGACRGTVAERDGAYHQGTVWAWLLGPWASAYYRVYGDAAAAQRFLRPIGDHLCDAGLGQVSEIFDGDPPHTPRGCPAQAWSVTSILEAWWRLEHAKAATGANSLAHALLNPGAAPMR